MTRLGIAPRWLCSNLIALFIVSVLPALAQQENAPPSEAATTSSTTTSSASTLTPDANGSLSQEQMRQLVRAVADKDVENGKLLRNYTYIERDEERNLDGKGNLKSNEIRTYEVMELYGEQERRLIAKEDKPLAAKEAAKEEARMQKIVDKRKDESDEERRKRQQRDEKDEEEGRKFVLEIADAYDFRLVGTEALNGRDAWVIEAEPRPGYEPHQKYANLLPKFHGRVWIDKGDEQWVKLDVEVIDTVSFGLFLARFHKGSRIVIEQTRVNDEVWLLKHVAVKVDARLALFKEENLEQDSTFRDYKRFRTATRIVGGEAVPEQ